LENLKGRDHLEDLSVDGRIILRGQFENFVDWRQCVAVMQREEVTVMASCSGGSNIAVA
jgi:hypothetical protein